MTFPYDRLYVADVFGVRLALNSELHDYIMKLTTYTRIDTALFIWSERKFARRQSRKIYSRGDVQVHARALTFVSPRVA